MSIDSGYLQYKIAVIKLMRESGHRTDEHGPSLTAKEVDRMENFFYWGFTPEEFVYTLGLESLIATQEKK